MLPVPFLKFIPKIFQADPRAVSLASKIDTYIASVKKEALYIKRFFRPDECSSIFLEELGYFFAANLKDTDTDRQKRKKIYDAVRTHKLCGTWTYDVKKRIDLITGYDARLWDVTEETADWILDGADGNVPDEYYWGTMGKDGVDDLLGLDLIGAGTEPEIMGNVYINCHYGITYAALTPAQLALIVNEIASDAVPAYFRVYLGWVSPDDEFAIYSGGIIE